MTASTKRTASLGFFLLALLAAGFFLWPAQLGGATAYVSTHGTSMEPGFRTGDLAVLRPVEDYNAGDVAAYRSDMFDTVVMHRIVAVQDGRYTLRGDNNSWLDPEHPTRSEFIGKLALRVPQGGHWLQRMTEPMFLAALFAVALLAGGATTHARHRHRRRTMSSPSVARRVSSSLSQLPARVQGSIAACAVLALVGMSLGVAAWASPTTEKASSGEDSGQRMSFSYSATVPRSPAYDGTTVSSPDTVFRKLVDTLRINYTYTGAAPATITPVAKLSTASGWHSTVPLGPPVDVVDSDYTGTLRLDLDALEARADAAAAATGIPASQTEIAVIPEVTSDGLPTFSPAMNLTLTPLQLSLTGEKTNPSTTEATSTAPDARSLDVAGLQLSVASARTASVLLVLAALAGLVLIVTRGRLRRPISDRSAIDRRYGRMLVEVDPMPTPTGRPVIDVVDFATLARLAERYDLLVLHWLRSDVDTYVVQDQGVTYRYRCGTAPEPDPSSQEEAFSHGRPAT